VSVPRGAGSGRGFAWARTKRSPGRSPARGLLSLLIGLLAALSLPAAAAAQAIVEYPAPPGSNPGGITSGPDGALWFVGEGTSTIYRMTTGGAVTNAFPVPTSSSPSLDQITVGSDGALWFTQPGDNQIGRITTDGALAEYNALSGHQPEGITAGPDGALWYSATGIGKIGRIHPAAPGAVTEHPAVVLPGPGSPISPRRPTAISGSPNRSGTKSGGSRPTV